eukprot:scaffold42262_cov49-Phaeocystis_antarctica.AAC.4
MHAWSKVTISEALEAACLSTRGGGWDPSGRASSWECRAAHRHQARPEEAQAPSCGTAKVAVWPCGAAVPEEVEGVITR